MESWYHRKYRWLTARPAAVKAVILGNKGFTALVYAAYTLLALWALFRLPLPQSARVITVPTAGFLLGTALRTALNRPRPYEVLGLPALGKKKTKGQSFPSRHVFCAAVISTAFWYVSTVLGVVFAAVAVLLAALRVAIGVHWVRDVLAGLAFGWGIGIIGFWLL